ncbi:hypothetical protein G9A89_016076 [Geosiphon pyriformis]|nr:hypothetical protein G9A89_016076 [Geosiphon pyriformis]
MGIYNTMIALALSPILMADKIFENKNNHSENLESKKTESESEKITENEKEMSTAYIAKISEFTGKNNNTSFQEWLDKVQKAGDANVLQNSGQQRLNYYYIQPSYLTIPEESDFQQTALSEGEVATLRSNSSNNTISSAQIAQNANLLNIFSFEFEANELPFLLSNTAVNEQKAITTMYTKAKVEGKPIQLILDSRSAGSIITYQLMQQLQKTVDRPAQTVIVTADRMKKTPVEEIDNFPFTIDGITIPVKFGEPKPEEEITTTSIYLTKNQSAIQFKYFNNNGKRIKPKKAHEIDTGYNLKYSGKDTLVLQPKSLTKINLRIALKIPLGAMVQIAFQSSLASKEINVREGVIDAGYTGDITIMLQNKTNKLFRIEHAKKIAQAIYLLLINILSLQSVNNREQLGKSKRKMQDFGSTE